MVSVKFENIQRQLKRLNTLTNKEYFISKDNMVNRYCLITSNGEQITLWLKIGEFWDCMYSMIRILQHETDKPRTWEGDL